MENQQQAAQQGVALPMIVLILATFMSVLDTTIINVSIPKMMSVFGVGTSDIQWVVTAYSLVVGALVPITGYLGDNFGYKRIFVYSVILFTIGSALCGMAWNNNAMIIFRILQAIGGGAIMPVAMAMMFRLFPPERRGLSMGIFGIAIMFAPAFGPTLGGYITEYLDWRLIFYINVPIGILDTLLALMVLQEFKQDEKKRFDFFGFLTSSAGFASLLYGLGIVGDKGWTDIEVIFYISVGLCCLVLFVLIEFIVEHPMIDLRVMKNSMFTISLVISSIASIALFASLFLLPVFLQNISGLSAVETGLVLLPQGIAAGIMMPISGMLFDKFGVKWLAITGLTITAYSFYLIQSLDIATSFSTVSWWLIIRAIGIGSVMMPVSTAGMNTVPMQNLGQASALTNTVRQVSSAFGIAWLSNLLSERQFYHVTINSEQMPVGGYAVTSALSQLSQFYSSGGLTGNLANSAATSWLMSQLQKVSTVQAMDDVFWVVTWVVIVAIVFAFFLKDTKAPRGEKPVIME
ncbi:DHA2 family efflux MFS transporter permease subunit [Effusibacillus dendaii]|nr:DHA2 family efflux MFS transporter permease subunit [Effusibacillus dendaii]